MHYAKHLALIVVFLAVTLVVPKFAPIDAIISVEKIVSAIAAALAALLWYRSAVAPLPPFPLGFDLGPDMPVVQDYVTALHRAAILNRWAAGWTAIAAAGMAYEIWLQSAWPVVNCWGYGDCVKAVIP